MIDSLYNIEAEENVLGFFFNRHIEEDKRKQILQLVQPDHFSDAKYAAFCYALHKYLVFDKIVLWDRIKDLPFIKEEKIEWIDLENIDDLVLESDVEGYIEILLDRYQRRRLHKFGKDVQEAMLKGENQYDIALRAQNILSHISSRTKLKTNEELLEKVLNETPDDIISTGFKYLDAFIGGFTRGMIVTIAGDSGHMKTTLALDQAFKMAITNPNLKIGIFSKEMTSETMIKKQISYICGIPIKDIFTQNYDKDYVKQKMMEVPAWKENRIRIVNPEAFTGVADIARIQMTYGFDIWFLDFIQLLEFAKQATSSSDYNIQIGQNMRNLQSLALATKSVGIVLSQVKKGIEYRKSKVPTISDIEWSGLIKQLSAYIFFSYYPGKYYGFDKISNDRHFLLGEKTRFAETFTYPLRVNPELGIFTEIEKSSERVKIVEELRKLID